MDSKQNDTIILHCDTVTNWLKLICQATNIQSNKSQIFLNKKSINAFYYLTYDIKIGPPWFFYKTWFLTN